MPSASAGGCEFKRSVPLKSYETEPIEDAAAVDPASKGHELVPLGTSPGDRSLTTEEEIGIEEGVVDS